MHHLDQPHAENTRLRKRRMPACVLSACSAMLPLRLLIRSNGNGALRKSMTTVARSFLSRKTSKSQKAGAPWRPRLRSQNISTAISRMALIRTKVDEKCQCGSRSEEHSSELQSRRDL